MSNTIKVQTESGTWYYIREADEYNEVRRHAPIDGPMRRDREWVKIYHFEKPEVGKRMVFLLEGLGELPFTARTTTPVVSIEEQTE